MLLDRPRIGNHLRRIVAEAFYLARRVRTEMRQILRCNVNASIMQLMIPVFRPLDSFLKRWARRKYQRFKSARKKTHQWLKRVRSQQFWLFPHLKHG